MFRTVLVHVDTSELATARTKLAVHLAKQFDATVIGVTAGMPRIPAEVYAGGYGATVVGPDYTDFDRKHLETEFGVARMIFDTVTVSSGVEADWRTALDMPSSAIVNAAAAADLLVLGAGGKSALGDLSGPSVGEVVMRVGRPVLVVPNGDDHLDAKRIVVAWKDTPEAQRAIADAVPFMKRAEQVMLISVQEGETHPADLDEAEAYLVRHGIAAKAEAIPRASGSVADAILDYARAHKADLIVSGAYGHGRLREWVFGGVTRGLLARAPVPCLLSH